MPFDFVRRTSSTALLAALIGTAAPAALANPLENGWELDTAASTLNFQSIKNSSKVETSSFKTFGGMIEPDGTATIQIQMESVDTKVDLRNVRMRFLLFQTFQFPTATITTKLDPEFLAKLEKERRLPLMMDYTLDFHGVSKQMQSPVTVTLISDDLVSVTSKEPISIATKDFDLDDGIARLEAAAKVAIVPSSSVTFDFAFKRIGGTKAPEPVAAVATAPQQNAAVEPTGVLTREACVGRFEILSRSGSVNFKSGSAALDDQSIPMLDSVADIVTRCPDLDVTVAGHTDSSGDDAFNQKLSEKRAQTVTQYLVSVGVTSTRVRAVGYGETQPVVDNTTASNRSLNRRIEFRVDDNS